MPLTQVSPGLLDSNAQYYGFKNRLINGGMVIDQRNNGASVTVPSSTTTYTVDRWQTYCTQASRISVQRNAGGVTPPAGFINYAGITSLSAYSVTAGDLFVFGQPIEGLNISDLAWGTANAQPVTVSFWVRSSLTGTFGAVITNNPQNRTYPFSFVINAANTWEQKTVTIPGDTTGTWLTTNSVGLFLFFSMGAGSTYTGTAGAWVGANLYTVSGAQSVVGTNGATFYITGVQLEKGSTATSFDYRPYGTELALCQRYFFSLTPSVGNYLAYGSGVAASGTAGSAYVKYPVTMRAAPTITYSNLAIYDSNTLAVSSLAADYRGLDSMFVNLVFSGSSLGRGIILMSNNTLNSFINGSAEL